MINNIAELDKEINNIVSYANLLNKDKLSNILKKTDKIKKETKSKDWYLREINEALKEIYTNIEQSQLSESELEETFGKFQ